MSSAHLSKSSRSFRTSTAALVFLSFLASACGDDASSEEAAATSGDAATDEPPPLRLGQIAKWPTKGWETKTPEEVGMDPKELEKAFKYAFVPEQNTQSVVIIRGGALIAERYRKGTDENTFGASWSAAKSFASALIGIAIDEGKIDGVDVSMATFFPEWKGTEKAKITLKDVLQMQSGLAFVEDYADLRTSDVAKMGLTDDVLAYVRKELPVAYPPGTRWYYSSGDTMLLSGAIEQATGMNATEYGKKKLFGPIGMAPVDWWVDGKGHTLTFCCLDTPSREFAKFGLLFLRDGKWDGKQVVSSSWVKESTTAAASDNHGYAYQWWLKGVKPLPADLYEANGLQDQHIYVIPSLDLVVVRHGHYDKPDGEAVAPNGYLAKFVPGRATNGTLPAKLWQDDLFLAPIINSIAGAPHVEAKAIGDDPGSSDPKVCKEKAHEYGNYCEEVHGCACDTCPLEFSQCDADPGCREIIQCALEVECRGVACVTPCKDPIEAHGGAVGTSAKIALSLSECITPCATSCDGEAKDAGNDDAGDAH